MVMLVRLYGTELRRDLNRLDTGLGFVPGFLPLTFGDRVQHNTRTSLYARMVVPNECRADGDRHIHIPAEIEITGGAAVNATVGRLQLVDDIDCPRFRRSGKGSCGES